MASRSRSVPITTWRGLNERRIIGEDPRETSSLDNVIVRNGIVLGRRGINEFDAITTAETDTPIIGLGAYYRSATQATDLLRFSPTKVRKWNDAGNSWDDITGTALTGTSTTRPQYATIGELDMFVFTNEGEDRPRKYTGSGNTAVLAAGTAPFAKCLEYWIGFLALGNISDDGSTFSPLDVRLSDDPDGTWEECDDTELYVTTLTLDESPGDVLALRTLGTSLLAYKSDAIINIAFTPGPTRFRRLKLDFPMGILAPLSLQALGNNQHIFLAQDKNLYLCDGQRVSPLPPNVQVSLQAMSASVAPYVRSAVDLDTETYHLFYQRNGSTYLDGRLSYNYRTGEFHKSVYPVEFNSAVGFRTAPTAAWKVLASSSTLTYELEHATKDDNGTRVSRYFDVDWSQLGTPGDKYLTGGEFVFKRTTGGRVRISVGVDKSSKLQFAKNFSLKGEDPDETEVRIAYQLPTPLMGSWFKFRVEIYHDTDAAQVQFLEFEPESFQVHQVAEDNKPTSNSAFKGV
jgi:hypothetical protein